MTSAGADRITTARGAAGTLAVAFSRVADRLGHRVLIAAEGEQAGERVLLESWEGTAAEHWPASPPLQSLLIEARPEQTEVALLVGMAGTAHWSASIETLAQSPALLFDYACRISNQPDFLGATYRVAEGGTVEARAGEWAILSPSGGIAVIRPLENCAGTLSGDRLTLTCLSPTAVSKTRRWRYEIRLEA